jgi:lipoyl(octanoyl) transferase
LIAGNQWRRTRHVFPERVPRRRAHKGGSLNHCSIVNLGLIGWAQAYALQQRVVACRKAGTIADTLLLCEHPHTITLGRNGNLQNLLASDNVLRQKGVELHHTNRGGDITYHGPGQVVGYPIVNLAAIKRDVGWYMRTIEEAMIRASADFGVTAAREPGKTGIWVEQSGSALPAEKLAAIGVHLSRWVTSHGFAYNVATDLRYFQLIVPCGIAERKATSLEKLLGRAVPMADVADRISRHLFAALYARGYAQRHGPGDRPTQFDMRPLSGVQFLEELQRAERSAPASLPQTAATPEPSRAALEAVRSDA